MQDAFIVNLKFIDASEGRSSWNESQWKIKMELHSTQLDTFWYMQLNTLPQLVNIVFENLVPFSAICLCESSFSTLLHMKAKARNIKPCDNMRVAISNKEPCYSMIIEKYNKRAINYVWLLVNFVNLLCHYICCSEIKLVPITVWF